MRDNNYRRQQPVSEGIPKILSDNFIKGSFFPAVLVSKKLERIQKYQYRSLQKKTVPLKTVYAPQLIDIHFNANKSRNSPKMKLSDRISRNCYQSQQPMKVLDFQKYIKRHNIIHRKPEHILLKEKHYATQIQKGKRKNLRKLENVEIKIELESLSAQKSAMCTKTNLFNPVKSKLVANLAKISLPKDKDAFRFYLGPGNNCQLIRQLLMKRKLWTQTTEYDTIFNLRWQQATDKSWYQQMGYQRLKQYVNHLENHEQISTKAGLIQSLRKHCGKNGLDMYDFFPMSFVLDWSQPQKLQVQLKNFIFYFYANHPKLKGVKKQKQYIQLAKSFSNKAVKFSNFTFDRIKALPQLGNTFKSQQNYIWMLKPSQLNRGRGIKIWNEIGSLSEIMIKSMQQRIGDTYVIQKYIQKPMLINGRKFDIRVWVMIDQRGKVYFFQQGYIRTSCQQFTINDIDNQYVHLTNNAIQQHSKKYGQFEDGNQLSFVKIDSYLPQIAPFRQTKLPHIKNISSLVIQSGYKKMVKNSNKCCFQIFGFDYMLDENGKIWLIEVNTNPCIQQSSNLLKKLIPRMLNDAFKIVLDPFYSGSKNQQIYECQGYQNQDNMWKPLESYQHKTQIH